MNNSVIKPRTSPQSLFSIAPMTGETVFKDSKLEALSVPINHLVVKRPGSFTSASPLK